MEQINVHDAKTNLSRILERVERGERIVIARAGRPVADLVPHTATFIRFGTLKGRLTVQDDAFTWPDADLETLFYGDDDPSRQE